MNNINFDNPYLLLIALPLLAFVIVSFIISINKENRSYKNIISFVIHLVIVVLITLAFARTTYQKITTKTKIYVLADVSYSSTSNYDLIDEYIDNLKENVPANSDIGVICFGKNQQVLVEPGEKIISVKNHTVDVSQTDIKAALEYTATLFEENVIKRIVIISDGKETNKSNITSVVQSLTLDNIYIDAIYLDNNIKEDVNEVQINSVDYTLSTFKDSLENVYVTVQANKTTKVFINLYCDNELYKQNAVTLYKGYNYFSFDLNTTEIGTHKYEFRLTSSDESFDTTINNNSYYFTQEVAEKLQVLFVYESSEDQNVALNLYGEEASITFCNKYNQLPTTVEDLCIYDEFVLSNVDIRKFNNHSQFVKSIDTLVSEFGKSLITLGNTYIQNNEDDETLSELSNMLPVNYGNDDDNKKFVTLLIDISRSMEQLDKLNMAKSIACTVVDNLDDDVMVSIIVFYGETKTLVTPTEAKNKEEIKTKINNLEPFQATILDKALQYTYSFVLNQPYTKKEIVLISDGLEYDGGEENVSTSGNKSRAIAYNIGAANITLSTILATPKVATEGETLMKDLAEISNGYFYHIKTLDEVKTLVLDKVLNTLTETVLEKNESPVTIMLPKFDLVKDITELPSIKGLYNNTSKTGSNVVLKATYTDITEQSYDIPLYTWWNYGNGKVTSFASSISGDWISNWTADLDATKVLSNITEVNIPSQRSDSAFIINTSTEGTITNISVKAPSLNQNSEITIIVTNPNGEKIEKQLGFDSENYITDIDTVLPGVYNIELSYKLFNIEHSTNYSFNISYLPEYDSFTLYEASNLYYMVSSNGQVSENGELVITNKNLLMRKYIIDFTPILMTICVILFVFDIINRKLRLQDIKSLFKSSKKDKLYR